MAGARARARRRQSRRRRRGVVLDDDDDDDNECTPFLNVGREGIESEDGVPTTLTTTLTTTTGL